MPLSASRSNTLLFEIAWEVCLQLGGIYTVIRTKAPRMVRRWEDNYCLLGPYDQNKSPAEFKESEAEGLYAQVIDRMHKEGFDVRYGRWLCTERPQAILFNTEGNLPGFGEYKYHYWETHQIEIPDDKMLNQVVALGYMTEKFFTYLGELKEKKKIVAHFHEWMAGAAIPNLRLHNIPVSIVFTTHATMLGRYLAMNDNEFYEHLPFYDWHKEASKFNIQPQVRLERAAAHGAHTFTTVSDITAIECKHLLGRDPDTLVPNGLNIERFLALHEFQNLHRMYKSKIHEFVMGHFFPSYTFDLDKTLYFFSSGRFEFTNKGFDCTIDALARLNYKMQQEKSDKTIVFFLITKQPVYSIIADVLNRRAMMETMRKTCDEISEQIQERLFASVAQGVYPKVDNLVDDYWQLRLRQFIHEWKVDNWPSIVTHEVVDNANDAVLHKLRECGLLNQKENPVKVVYHPDFINGNNPLFDMDYDQFVRGCHLGVFPSTYEPWGYTPLECIARGVPAVTSNLAGFGSYVSSNIPEEERAGLYITERKNNDYHTAVDNLTSYMFDYIQMDRRNRISLRNNVEASSVRFDWSQLGKHYDKAHKMAQQKSQV